MGGSSPNTVTGMSGFGCGPSAGGVVAAGCAPVSTDGGGTTSTGTAGSAGSVDCAQQSELVPSPAKPQSALSSKRCGITLEYRPRPQ